MPSIEANNNHPIAVVVGIVQHPISHKFLISKRRKGQDLAGLWEFPGGKVEVGEGLFHTLKRELYEEVGIDVHSAYPLKQITHHFDEKSVCLNFWFVTQFTGEAESKEGQTVEWVDFNQLNQYEFPKVNDSIIPSLLLTPFWMITPDCQISLVDEFISSTINAIKKHKLKQVLFRSKSLNDKDYFFVYKKISKKCDALECKLILNRPIINAALSNFWHLTSSQLHQYSERPVKGGFLSASCHSIEDFEQAEMLNVDVILLSAVKKTKSHPDGDSLGWHKFKQLSQQTPLPIYALGGLIRDDLAVARYHGAVGIAGITAFEV